jgi:hypothetical protein
MAELERRDIYVSNLQVALNEGEHGLSAVPGHIKKIIKEDMWQDRIVQATGERAQFDQFSDFMNAPPPKGLGADADMLKRMCEDDEEALRLLREETTGEHGGDRGNQHTGGNVNNINDGRSAGSSKDYTLDRLAREDAELYERVVEGEMSANQAAIEAGFRDKKASIPVHKGGTPQIERAAKSLAGHFDGHLTDLIDELKRHV